MLYKTMVVQFLATAVMQFFLQSRRPLLVETFQLLAVARSVSCEAGSSGRDFEGEMTSATFTDFY